MDLEQLTYELNGAVFEVNKVLGPGFLEKVYENALLFELHSRGISAASQVPIEVRYKGHVAGEYLADIVVDEKIVIELKTLDSLQKMHEAQLLNYMKATEYQFGWLINFRHSRAEIRRFKL